MNSRISFTVILLFTAVAYADEPAVRTHHDDFDGQFDIEWDIINREPDGYSLETNPGELTMITLQGSMWRTNEGRLAPRNIFLVDDPVQADEDFEAVLHVTSFEPTGLYQQIGIVVFQDTNNFVKNTFEWRGQQEPQTCVIMTTESEGEPGGKMTPTIIDGPIWLRIRRTGTSYAIESSNDGEDFVTATSVDWVPNPVNKPVRVGMICKKGPGASAPDIPAVVEAFDLSIQERGK